MAREDLKFTTAPAREAFLDRPFVISKDEVYDYYSTNSGIFPKNPGPGGGGGGVEERVGALEGWRDGVSRAAEAAIPDIEGVIPREDVAEIDDIVATQYTLVGTTKGIIEAM